MKNKSLIGWIVAAVLAAGLAGVLIYDATTGGGGRPAAIGGVTEGTPPPADVAADVAQIRANKPEIASHTVPGPPADRPAPQLDSNPQGICDPNLQPNAFAEWENLPQNLNQAAGMANQILVGTATGAQAGPAYTTEVQGEPGGVVSTPVQNVTIRVDQAVKGQARTGGVVTIERLGDAQGCIRVAGDPPYETGQQYLLLLEDGGPGHAPRPISPAGRYMVGVNNALQAVVDNPVAVEIAGQKLNQVLTRLQGR